MHNRITLACPHCSAPNEVIVSEGADNLEAVQCQVCGQILATIGQLHAKIAQQAAGIGNSDLADDHVPLGGPPFGSTT